MFSEIEARKQAATAGEKEITGTSRLQQSKTTQSHPLAFPASSPAQLPPLPPAAMGRRKIEIQPITRKNGLFKKAYELGVLCSVDVAVIIFEERPGHHHKLYQYCSTDIRDVVARHVQYDGERDTRGPADFSGAGAKVDEAADDDDDADEEEAPPPKPKVRARKVSKDDMDYRSMAIPSPPISVRNLPANPSNAIPTSSARSSGNGNVKGNGNGMHPPSSKKPRLASHARSDDEDAPLTLPPPTSGGYNFPPVQQYRGGGGGGGGGGSYGVSPTQSSAFFPPLFDPPPPPFRGQYDAAMYQQLVRSQQQQQQRTHSQHPPPNPFSVDWPVHATPTPTPHGASSWNIDHFINSIMYPDPQVPAAQDGNNWLDFLSGASGLPPGGPSRGAGSTSWERGGGGGGGGGDGNRGGGGGGGGKRRQSGSRSSSEAGRGEDKDG
ncbi:hypothetical protein DFH09DRAFT_1326020 [Mycena vulgaris]|nr:hypothetical protein DFH09DRAFT_1326020 [Mycena vulgaris]